MPRTPKLAFSVQQNSCIVRKFMSLVPLSSSEQRLLEALEGDVVEIPAGEMVLPLEEDLPPLCVVKKGWLVSEHMSRDGHRTIVRTHHPGDVIGFTELPYRTATYNSFAKSNAVICPFPRKSLHTLLATSPRLAAIFLAVSLIEQSQQEDRSFVSGRNHAAGKLSLFLLQTLDRLQMVNHHSSDQFFCPMTQTDIGDLVGLTNVHVSRTFKQLEDAHFIRRRRSFIQILNVSELELLAGYTDRFSTYDFSWLPKSSGQ